MRRPHHLLQNHRHLFFFQAIGRGAHISLGVLAEGRSVDALDRLGKFVEADLQAGLLVAQHEGLVDAGEGLVLRVFEQAGGTDGERVVHFRKKCFQTFLQRDGQRGIEEALLDLVVVVTMQREVAQIVFGEELVEQIGGDDHGGRNGNPHAGKATRDAASAQQMTDEGEAAGFASERAGTDS